MLEAYDPATDRWEAYAAVLTRATDWARQRSAMPSMSPAAGDHRGAVQSAVHEACTLG